MSLYESLKAAGIATDNHESDLYFPVTDESTRILSSFPLLAKNATQFVDQRTGSPFWDVPFSFDPFWAGKATA